MSPKVLSKAVFQHFCDSSGLHAPMVWKPADMLSFQHPEVLREIRPFLPCVASFCPKCAELWVLPVKGSP